MSLRGKTTYPPGDIDQAIVALGIGADDDADAAQTAAQAFATAAIATHSAVVSAAGTHGRVKQLLVAGGDEAGAGVDITVSGMAVGDIVISVLVLTATASIATAAFRAVADFTVAAGKLTVAANAVNNTNNSYLITYLDAA